MTSPKLAGFLKSHWPLAVIAIAVAVLAFAAGALTSNRGAADESTPATSGAPPPYTPSPPTPLPTSVAGGASASACDGFLAPSGICIPENTGVTTYYTSGLTTTGTEIGLSSGRVLQLPPDVYIENSIALVSCDPEASFCPETPAYKLRRGDAVVWIDYHGVPYPTIEWDADTFPFLPVTTGG